MKKTILMMLMILLSLVASAQIQRTVYNLKLGSTSFYDVKQQMTAKGWNMSPNTIFADAYNIVPERDNISFDGLTWGSMILSFKNNILCQVKFLNAGVTNKISRTIHCLIKKIL